MVERGVSAVSLEITRHELSSSGKLLRSSGSPEVLGAEQVSSARDSWEAAGERVRDRGRHRV